MTDNSTILKLHPGGGLDERGQEYRVEIIPGDRRQPPKMQLSCGIIDPDTGQVSRVKCPRCGKRSIKDFTTTRFVNPYMMLRASVGGIKAAAIRLRQTGKCQTAYDLYGDPIGLLRMIAEAVQPVLEHTRQTQIDMAGQRYGIETIEIPEATK